MFTLVLVSSASAATITRSLDLGATGADVTSLQTYLATDSSLYPSGLVTGYYGQLTKAAVERFQTREGIVTSGTPATTGYGRVGPSTMAALNAKMNGTVTNNGGTSPSIYSTSVSTTNSSASLNWNTNEGASGIVYYGTSFPSMTESSANTGVVIGGSSTLAHTDLRTSHATTLTSLNPSTMYYYVLYARDGQGNESISWPATFQTSN
jgi:peptidoglycan hydrolase-like protein with peptidoglycan-binding domain